jgi:TonB family protein
MNANPIKIKIMGAKPEITDEEIRKLMDFDNLLKLVRAKELQTRRLNRQRKNGLYITGIILLMLIGYFSLNSVLRSETPASVKPNHSPDAAKEISNKSSVAPAASQVVPKPEQVKTPSASAATPPTSGKRPAAEKILVKSTFTEAEPAAGFPALYEYFNRQLKYPPDALKDSIQGVITVKFEVNELGQPEKIKILNSLGNACDQEALRLITNMPAWKPALLDGKPVSSKISLPLTFQIKVNKSK